MIMQLRFEVFSCQFHLDNPTIKIYVLKLNSIDKHCSFSAMLFLCHEITGIIQIEGYHFFSIILQFFNLKNLASSINSLIFVIHFFS